MEPWGLVPFKPTPDPSFLRLRLEYFYTLADADWSPSNPPQTDPSFASGENGFMANGAMGIRTPDLLNAIEALYQLSYDPLPKPKQIAESAQCHNPLAKEIVLLAVPSPPSFSHDEPD